MILGFVGKVGGFKSIDATIIRGSADYMVLNPTLDFCQPSLVVVGIFKERIAYCSTWFVSIIVCMGKGYYMEHMIWHQW